MAFKIPSGNATAFDSETTGLFPHKGDRPYLFSFCNVKGETSALYFPVNPFTRQPKYDDRLDIINDWAKDTSIQKIGHNVAFDVRMCKAIGIIIKGEIICTMSLIRVVRSNEPMGLKLFCAKNLGISDDDEKELKEATQHARKIAKTKGYATFTGKGTSDSSLAPDYWLAPQTLSTRYALVDAARAMAVYLSLMPEIKKEGLEKIWQQEIETWKVLRKIERKGIRVFPEKIKATTKLLKKKLQTFQKQLPKNLNPNSPLQLQKLFYNKLKESQLYSTKAGFPSTDVDALKAFKHPLAKVILNIRACSKTLEFMDQYRFHMRKHKDGLYYIHPTLHQAMTATGRDSCSDPNLQQVAKGKKDNGVEILTEARSIFGPRPNYRMRSYDWSQQEVFIPAYASGEKVLIDMLEKGEDVHQYTSQQLIKQTGIMVDRDKSKQSFFSLQYGIGDDKLSKKLGVKKNVATVIRNGFRKAYPALHAWIDRLIYEAEKNGFVKTAYGRILRFERGEAYKAPNYYTQGTGGGIIRNARIKINKEIKKKEWDAFITMPIHDEFLIEVNTDFIKTFDAMVVSCMQDNSELNIPIAIPVSISAIGEHWADKIKVVG